MQILLVSLCLPLLCLLKFNRSDHEAGNLDVREKKTNIAGSYAQPVINVSFWGKAKDEFSYKEACKRLLLTPFFKATYYAVSLKQVFESLKF